MKHQTPQSVGPHGALLALLMMTAAWTALAGAGDRLPLDAHDVLVARTSEEMIERRQWLVPYISDEPRLKKPPMNYWLNRVADAATGGDGVITPFEARLPSIVAGVALVMLTYALGKALADARTGLVGAMMLASGGGFVSYTHSARPEMTYALFTTLGLLGFILSDRWLDDPVRARWARWCAWGGWAAWGLAMLTKGPQLPAIALAGELIHLWRTGGRARALRVLRPGTGLLVFAMTSLWWYVAVLVNVTDAWDIWFGEIRERGRSGSRGWRWLVDPYYLYRVFVLVAPWVALYPLALAGPWVLRRCGVDDRADARPTDSAAAPPRPAWRLWTWVVVGMALLSLAPGRRWYYFLPLLPALCLLMAMVGLALGRRLLAREGGGLWAALVALHMVGLGVVLPAVWFIQPSPTRPAALIAWGAAAIALLAAVVVFARLRRGNAERDHEASAAGSLVALGLVAALVLGLAAQAGSLWGASRLARDQFARQVAATVPRAEPLLGWRRDSEIEVYHAKRAIPRCDDATQLASHIADCHRAWMLTSTRGKPPQPPPGWTMTTALNADFSDEPGDDDRVELLRLDRLPPAAGPGQ